MASPIFRQGLSGILGTFEAFDGFGFSLGVGDFNNDNQDDLAIGVPFEDLLFDGLNAVDAGAVNVLYGSTTGLTTIGNNFWNQGSSSIEEHPEGKNGLGSILTDNFGHSVGAGDFDGDGFDDLAIGVPGENIDNLARSGAVNVIYGSSSGLTAVGNQLWHQDRSGIKGKAQEFEEYGSSLTVGDFDGDDVDDLAIGIPGDNTIGTNSTQFGAGAVNVLYGSSDVGLSSTGSQLWTQSELSIVPIRDNDRFGSSVAAGDFNGDSRDDLAIGVPFKELFAPYREDAGGVVVLYSNSDGLAKANAQVWAQGWTMQGTAEASDRCATVLAVGDFDGDNKEDLVIGSPFDNEGGVVDSGAVNILYGSSSGLSSARNQLWRQSNLAGSSQQNDLFGSSLAVGDFNNDGWDDLAVGTPKDSVNGISAGSVNIIYGRSEGLSALNNDRFHQEIQGIPGVAQAGDEFGKSLGVGDYNGDGFADLAIGVPGDNPDGRDNAGVVTIIFGSSAGLEV